MQSRSDVIVTSCEEGSLLMVLSFFSGPHAIAHERADSDDKGHTATELEAQRRSEAHRSSARRQQIAPQTSRQHGADERLSAYARARAGRSAAAAAGEDNTKH